MFKDHFSCEESTNESLYFNDRLNSLLVNLNAIIVIFPVIDIVLLILLLKLSFLFIFVNSVIVHIIWRMFAQALHVHRWLTFLLIRSACRDFEMLLIKISSTLILLVPSLVMLWLLAFVLHLFHWVIEPKVSMHAFWIMNVSAVSRYHSVNYIIAERILMLVLWTHLVVPNLMLIWILIVSVWWNLVVVIIGKLSTLLIGLFAKPTMLSSRLVRLRIFKSAIVGIWD